MTDVRGEPSQIDRAWMTEALESGGVARGATVLDVDLVGFIGTGQTGRNARFALTWDDPDGRPASVVGKFPSGDPAARAAAFENGTYHNEWEFYSELAPTLDIRVPEVHVARYCVDTPDFVLIMEDLAGSRHRRPRRASRAHGPPLATRKWRGDRTSTGCARSGDATRGPGPSCWDPARSRGRAAGRRTRRR